MRSTQRAMGSFSLVVACAAGLFAAPGCGNSGDAGGGASGSASAAADDSKLWEDTPVAVGDAVVAPMKSRSAWLRVGKATKVAGDQITVKLDDGGSQVVVAAAEVFERPPSGRTTMRVKKGDVVLYTTNDTQWEPGEVVEVNEKSAKVVSAEGHEDYYLPGKVIRPTDAQKATVQRLVVLRKFLDEAKKLYPENNSGYKFSKDERLIGIVQFAGVWEPGTCVVEGTNKPLCKRVKWDDAKVDASDQAQKFTRLAPIPPADKAPEVKKDDYVLMKSTDASKTPWLFARVLENKGEQIVVETGDGDEVPVPRGDYALLVKK